jgi:hypothetical protein
MSDLKFRRLERQAFTGGKKERLRFLQHLIRSGFNPHYMELAAYLGNGWSLLLYPEPQLPSPRPYESEGDDPEWSDLRLVLRRGKIDRELLTLIAIDWAHRLGGIFPWLQQYPHDTRPQLALEAAQNWLDGVLIDFDVHQVIETAYDEWDYDDDFDVSAAKEWAHKAARGSLARDTYYRGQDADDAAIMAFNEDQPEAGCAARAASYAARIPAGLPGFANRMVTLARSPEDIAWLRQRVIGGLLGFSQSY